MFRIKHLSKSFETNKQKQLVLNSLSFNIKKNSFTAISGPSGSGKSTLLSIISGLEQADDGEIEYENTDLLKLNNAQITKIRNEEFGFIFQSPFYIPYKNVIENILLPTQYKADQTQSSQFESAARTLANSVGLKNHLLKSPAVLSGGEQQRMTFARALILQPKVIFADEPTASIDRINSIKLLSLLKNEVQSGKTVIMVSHDPMALEWADEIFELKNEGSQIVKL